MSHAISVTTADRGPATIPIQTIRLVRQGEKREAIIVFNDGREVNVKESYKIVSEQLTEVRVWGTISIEQVF
ncbi:hypothetical protein [Thalassoglobus sp.]|uniref:hypothetical protein n=1 Tax=Thalassoglobus sp. TaxID=2795869 RepID=UPI003AA9A52F